MPGPTQQSIIRPRASAVPRRTTADRRAVMRAPQPPDDDDGYDDDQWPPRLPTTIRRYSPIPPAALPRRRGLGRAYIAVVFSCVFIGVVLTAVIPPAWQRWRDSSTYGYPRTYQTNANVGHGDPRSPNSHFIALNNNGTLEVIEIPGGDPATHPPKLYLLALLTGTDADLVVVTVSFADVNGDGKLDLIASYNGTEVILFNDGTKFVAKL